VIVLFACERWDDLLKTPVPDSSFLTTTAVWHALRGDAFAHLGKTEQAEQEQKSFRELAAKIPADQMYDELNLVGAVMKVHDSFLAGAIAKSRGDTNAAIESWKQAVAAQDALNYSEPPAWYPPVRPMLGRLLLANNQAAEAEKVFREDLERNPRHGRALGGLRDALKAQNRPYEADQIDQQFRATQIASVASTTEKSR
jgi:predicted negative regulator of RcsB-dependent stress response